MQFKKDTVVDNEESISRISWKEKPNGPILSYKYRLPKSNLNWDACLDLFWLEWTSHESTRDPKTGLEHISALSKPVQQSCLMVYGTTQSDKGEDKGVYFHRDFILNLTNEDIVYGQYKPSSFMDPKSVVGRIVGAYKRKGVWYLLPLFTHYKVSPLKTVYPREKKRINFKEDSKASVRLPPPQIEIPSK